jgi:hypothetical protein
MNLLAVLSIRNDSPYVANCLEHLVANGARFAVIDNGSEDGLHAILERPTLAQHLVHYEHLPWTGHFELRRILEAAEAIISRLDADWYLLLDADEVMHSYREGETLNEALQRADADGATVVNFDEFVFLPIDHDYVPENPGWQPLPYYYFYEPSHPRLMRARKRSETLSAADSGGHVLDGDGLHLWSESLALRHYVFRSAAHAQEKYPSRVYAPTDLARGWHGNRIGLTPEAFRMPDRSRLKWLAAPDVRDLDRSTPERLHFWEWN